MAFAIPFRFPFRSSPALTNLSGGVWDCAINGRPYRFDRSNEAFAQGPQSLAILRQQADNSIAPGEGSINREDLWRKSQSSWHHGAGQRYFDKEDSDAERFWASQGVNVWQRDQLSLLNSTSLSLASAVTTVKLLSVGNFIYAANGTAVSRFDGTSWTSIPFTAPTGTISSLATNGFNVWATTPTKTYVTNTGTTTWTDFIVDPYELVAYARGRLLVSHNENISEVVGGTATELNPSEGNTAWRWTSITEGTAAIYAAGFAGNRSQIFKITPPTDDPAAALGVPIPAAPPLPTGEVVRALYGYLGQIVIGTDRGVRVAEEDSSGNLTIGALIETPSGVTCLEGLGSFVYFGWSTFDSTHTGLGRLNLAQQTDSGVYAYASDVMAEGTGIVTSCTVLNSKAYFSVSGTGIFAEQSTPVTSGWLQSGYIRYGVVDSKIAKFVELRHKSLKGAIGVALAVDGSSFASIGESNLSGTVTPIVAFDANDRSGTNLETQVTLIAENNNGPVVEHIELRSAVVPVRGTTFLVPLKLSYEDSQFEARHPSEDFDALVALARYQRSATYQERSKVFNVIVQDFQFIRNNNTNDGKWWNGTMVLRLMSPAS